MSKEDKIRERELYWINYYDTFENGCNCSLDTGNALLKRKTYPLTEEHKQKLHEVSKTKKEVFVYTENGDLVYKFPSTVNCDKFFNLKKGRTSWIISGKSNMKRINKQYIPKFEYISKEDWNFTIGHTEESYRQAGLKHRGKVISQETRNKIRLNNPNSLKVVLKDLEGNVIKYFNSLNECDDFLNMTRGCTSKVLKGKARTLKRKYIPELIC